MKLAGSSGDFRLARFGRGLHLVEPPGPYVVDREKALEWTFLSPSAVIGPGEPIS